MKLITFIFLLIISIGTIFSACSPPDSQRYYNSIGIPFVYKDSNSSLHFDGPNNYFTFNKESKQWVQINDSNISDVKFLTYRSEIYTKQFVSETEYISYENGIAIVKSIETNETVSSEVLPTVDEIAISTGINLYETQTSYVPMLSGQLSWDGKTHLASVCIGKNSNNCDDVYIFSLSKEIKNWDIRKVISYAERFEGRHSSTGSLFEKNHTYNFFDENIGMCIQADYGWEYAAVEECFIREEGEIVLKKVFGEIYPIEYKNIIDSIYKNVINVPRNYTIDEQGNMHLFYNKKEDIKNENYDYFWYGYFTKENPTTPLYEQKIPWK